MKPRSSLKALPVIATAWLMVAGTAAAKGDDGQAQMARRLADLRGEVEDLTAKVDSKKEELRGQLRSYAAQKADVEMEIQRAKMTLKQLVEAKEKRVTEVEKDSRRDEVIKPAVLTSVGVIKKSVTAGLPFKLDERTADLDRLIRQMDEGILAPTTAVARLWDRVEDEYRLARENGLYRQVVEIDGEEKLVDVAKIGMAMMYYKTVEGETGRAVKSATGWGWKRIAGKEAKEQIWELFESFKKQIRVGFFLLPGALPMAGAK